MEDHTLPLNIKAITNTTVKSAYEPEFGIEDIDFIDEIVAESIELPPM